MKPEDAHKKFAALFSKCERVIGYAPCADEIDYSRILPPENLPEKNFIVPNDKYSDPFEWAARLASECGESRACIFVPGTAFDAYGTRHGRGYGWYDRFLSRVPPQWLRVGIASAACMSPERLMRQPWDEPVDWILTVNASSLLFSVRIDETHARKT